jgi:putative membrane protein
MMVSAMHIHEFIPPLTQSSLIIWLILLAAWIAYLFAALNTRACGSPWHIRRDISFSLGIILIALALSPPVMNWAHHDLRVHMVQHLLIGMFAPLFLALSLPMTLALRNLPVGIARVLSRILRSNGFYWLSHPVSALLLNIGGMYLLYLTPLYAMSLSNSWIHYLMHLHFVLAGYLFVWAIAGPDPTPRRASIRMRLIVLFAAIAAHSYLSKLMYVYLWPIHPLHSSDEIREAAKIMYYGGDFAELLLAVALFMCWYKNRIRRSAASDIIYHPYKARV